MNKNKVLQDFNNDWKKVKGYTWLGEITQKGIVKAVRGVFDEINLTKNAKIIDMGCGLCKMLTAFRKWGYKNSIGIDFSPESIKRCVEKGFQENKDIFLLDATNTNFSDGEFIVTFEEGVLEHYKDHSYVPFIKEMTRISNKYVLIAQPDHFSLYGRITQLFYTISGRGVKEYTYKMYDFIKVFEQENFLLKSIKKTGLRDWQILLFERGNK